MTVDDKFWIGSSVDIDDAFRLAPEVLLEEGFRFDWGKAVGGGDIVDLEDIFALLDSTEPFGMTGRFRGITV